MASESPGSRWRAPRGLWRWAVRAATLLGILAVVGTGLVPAFWPFTPSVADAPKRVADVLVRFCTARAAGGGSGR